MISKFIKAHCQSTIFLQALEVAFYNIAFLILFPIYFPLNFVRLFTRNTSICAFEFYQFQKFTGTISFISFTLPAESRSLSGRQLDGMNFGVIAILTYVLREPFFEPWR